MRVQFLDSSDDGASHEALMNVWPSHDNGEDSTDTSTRGAVSTSTSRQLYTSGEEAENKDTTRRGGSRGAGEWFSSVLLKGVGAASRLFLEPRNDSSHEPCGDASSSAQLTFTGPNIGSNGAAGSHMPDRNSSSSGGWEFDRLQHRSPMELGPSTESASSLEEGNDLEEDSGPEEVNLDLKDTLLLFMQTGSDVFMNIILATLKASNELVDGETFEIVSGSPELLQVLLDSGRVDIDDPRVQSVVQAKLDEVLSGDPYDGDVVSGDLLNYVRYLCNIRTSRITFQQMVLLRYSGFDYVELLVDYPHLMEDLEKPSFCIYLVFDVLHYISIAISWLGVLITLTFTAMMLWSVVFWLQQPEHRINGHWIIITYVGGYVVSLVATMRAEEGKIKRYENQVWHYPNNLFRIVPIIPVYEIMLSYALLRYEISANAKRFFVIRYDLRNGTLVQHIINGCFYALPQMVLQTYLFINSRRNYYYLHSACYWLLFGCLLTLITMSIFAYHRISFFTHSCNGFGFAVLSSQSTSTKDHACLLARRVHPSDIATKVLIFLTIYFFVAQTMTLIVLLASLGPCPRTAIIFPSIYMFILSLSIIVIVIVYVNLPFSRGMGAIGIPVGMMQIAFLVYINVGVESKECAVIHPTVSKWILPSITIFGLMCLSIVAWLGMLLFEFFYRERIKQRAVDYYILA
ncbi:hypothetical protein, conserved [Leishmania tarentolae]|uniref:Uncharacterized protein n=1 Tax=Leishmania tarentolae TaxID=5689 RepID=A0A640KR06_LEITA|nr:hypothetical protein, conserved [Leishmania tarentolae]